MGCTGSKAAIPAAQEPTSKHASQNQGIGNNTSENNSNNNSALHSQETGLQSSVALAKPNPAVDGTSNNNYSAVKENEAEVAIIALHDNTKQRVAADEQQDKPAEQLDEVILISKRTEIDGPGNPQSDNQSSEALDPPASTNESTSEVVSHDNVTVAIEPAKAAIHSIAALSERVIAAGIQAAAERIGEVIIVRDIVEEDEDDNGIEFDVDEENESHHQEQHQLKPEQQQQQQQHLLVQSDVDVNCITRDKDGQSHSLSENDSNNNNNIKQSGDLSESSPSQPAAAAPTAVAVVTAAEDHTNDCLTRLTQIYTSDDATLSHDLPAKQQQQQQSKADRSASDAAAATLSFALPSMKRFWAMKKGRINTSLKARYFVVQQGIVRYYLNSSDDPPFGTDFRGELSLKDCKLLSFPAKNGYQESIDLRILIQSKSDPNNRSLDLQASSATAKEEITDALQQHISFANDPDRFALSTLAIAADDAMPCRIRPASNSDGCPIGLRFWARKKGHHLEVFQERYLVLEKGVLRYYVGYSDVAPYGRELKGTMNLVTYKITQLPNNLLYLSSAVAGAKDLHFIVANNEFIDDILCVFAVHIDYANSKYTVNDINREEQVKSVADVMGTLMNPFTSSPQQQSQQQQQQQQNGATTAAAAAVRLDASSLPSPPNATSFWAKKKGHMNTMWKDRFVVVCCGYVHYFEKKQPELPFGSGYKGSICLAGYQFVLSDAAKGVCVSDQNDKNKDLDLELAAVSSDQAREEIIGILREHMAYATLIGEFDRRQQQQVTEADEAIDYSTYEAIDANNAASNTFSKRNCTQRLRSFASYIPNRSELNKWRALIPSNVDILVAECVNKPNPIGVAMMRQLLLLSNGTLLYVDPVAYVIKGTIVVATMKQQQVQRSQCIQENCSTFTVKDMMSKREYRFIDSANGSQFWIEAITTMSTTMSIQK